MNKILDNIHNISIDRKYNKMLNDIIKFCTILFTINLLMFMNNPSKNKLFSNKFIQLSIMIILGLLTYWLIIKELIDLDD